MPLNPSLLAWLQACSAEASLSGHLQLKRQSSDRGSDGESTKTIQRWKMLPMQNL